MEAFTPVINSNTKHFCSNQLYVDCNVNRINPDKFTFLKSNLLVSNLLNLHPSTQAPDAVQADAYTLRSIQLERSKQEEEQLIRLNRKVRNIAKSNSQAAFQCNQKASASLLKRLEEVRNMREEEADKAKEVLGGKEESAYLGRNIQGGEQLLKNTKESRPIEKIAKMEATRLSMREGAKRKNKSRDPPPRCSYSAERTLNGSFSTNGEARKQQLIQQLELSKEAISTHRLVTLMRTRSEQQFLQEQKRRAVWNGFADHWQIGLGLIAQPSHLKKKAKPRNHPEKVSGTTSKELLQYNDQFSRQVALKDYSKAFANTAVNFGVVCS